MTVKNDLSARLLEEVWNTKQYYYEVDNFIRSDYFSQNGYFKKLKAYSGQSKSILECGCGPATILELLWQKNKQFYGIDISEKSIALARKRLFNKKNIHISVGQVEKLKYKDNTFDLVFANAVMEHLTDPDKSVNEMIRVTKKKGKLIIMSPNYGSPFFPSVCSAAGLFPRIARFIRIIMKSHYYIISKPDNLNWESVFPKIFINDKYQPDNDAVNEPYLQTLVCYIARKKCKILECYSSPFMLTHGFRQQTNWLASLFKLIEKYKITPYCYYGPGLFIVACKL